MTLNVAGAVKRLSRPLAFVLSLAALHFSVPMQAQWTPAHAATCATPLGFGEASGSVPTGVGLGTGASGPTTPDTSAAAVSFNFSGTRDQAFRVANGVEKAALSTSVLTTSFSGIQGVLVRFSTSLGTLSDGTSQGATVSARTNSSGNTTGITLSSTTAG